MDFVDTNKKNESIREDIIDLQKVNGNLSTKQVVFNIPNESESTVSTNLAKSLESGLSKSKSELESKKKTKKIRSNTSNRQNSPQSDVDSWPSDSDITVLRMKMLVTSKTSDLKDKVGNLIKGDGLHQPDSSSMINLATLIRNSHRFNMEEYLMPLTSWEREQNDKEAESRADVTKAEENSNCAQKMGCYFNVYEAICSWTRKDICSSKDSQSCYSNKKSKLARFLRLYFCPCCTCLYELEKLGEDPSMDVT